MNGGDGRSLGEEAARRLARVGQCDLGPGLTDAEFARIEEERPEGKWLEAAFPGAGS